MPKRKAKLYMENPSSVDLPADIICEILLRLPVKTLLRFKCVCKLWCSLIGSPGFVKQHFGHESNQERLLIRHESNQERLLIRHESNQERLLIRKYRHFECTFALHVTETFFGHEEPGKICYAFEGHEICCGYKEPDYLQFPSSFETVIGPVNGVFFVIGMFNAMALVNPAMRQFKPLPLLPKFDAPHHLISLDNMLGLGLDPSTGDYKVVSIQYIANLGTHARDESAPVSVYSLSRDSWRYIGDLRLVNSSYYVKSLSNTYLDGVYYWLMEVQDIGVASILAFDMATEKFREIQVPDSIGLGKRDLALYGDSIALLSHFYDFDQTDKFIYIWVMKKEGFWTKLTFGPFPDIRTPLCFWKNNELLLETTRSSFLLLCDVITQKSRIVKARRDDHNFFTNWVFSYKESLVSIKLKGEKDNCLLWDTSDDDIKYFFEPPVFA